MLEDIRQVVEGAFDDRERLKEPEVEKAVEQTLSLIEQGIVASIEPPNPDSPIVVNEWVKKAILLYFAIKESAPAEAGLFSSFDKVPLRSDFKELGVRAVPGAIARRGTYLGKNVVLMPSFVNIGAHVGDETMVDTWATVGSCAWIGARVHLAGGVGIGGVLEPPSAVPVVVEDDVMIGSRAMITEGARVGQGAVVGAGVILNPSIPVIDVETGDEISRGYVPPWCVAVMGSRQRAFGRNVYYLPCLLVIKRLEPGARHDKSQLNEWLRDVGAST